MPSEMENLARRALSECSYQEEAALIDISSDDKRAPVKCSHEHENIVYVHYYILRVHLSAHLH